jgi:Cd2+/Zn2+-exporting ATPase
VHSHGGHSHGHAHGHGHGREAAQPGRYVLPIVLTVICAVSGLAGWAFTRYGHIQAALWVFAPGFIAGSWGPLKSAWQALRHRQLEINFLMLLAAWGAALLNQPGEGVALLFLFSLSGALEEYTLERTARSIDSLVQLRPDSVTVIGPDGAERTMLVAEVPVGALVRIVPGERVGVDGTITEGESSLDESTLTGEALPIVKTVGGEVFAGTLNHKGSLVVRVTKASTDSMLARIVSLVHHAQEEKVATQSRFESWENGYVWGVLALSLAAMVAHYFGLGSGHAQGNLRASIYAGMVFLVAASPCAVMLSIPAAVLSGLTRAARQGVLFKGGSHLERMAGIKAIALDKTGTLTMGRPEVLEVRELSGTPQGELELLEAAAAVERLSEHPLAEAVVLAAEERGLARARASLFHSHTGQGVHASVTSDKDEIWVGIGNRLLFQTHEVDVPEAVYALAEEQRGRGLTSLIVSGCGRSGVIGIADKLRSEAPAALAALRRLGAGRIVVLTGDHRIVGETVATAVGADSVRAELLPEQKVEAVKALKAELGSLAFVGDGVNDGPALATADVGIAMGGRGTDVALETADVVLMRDDLRALPFALWLAKRTQATILRGLVIAFGVIGFLLFAAAFLNIPLWLAVLMHEGSTVVTILSGMVLLVEPYRQGQ